VKREPSHRPRLRTRVLVGVLAVTLVALAAFDVAAVAALRGYLIGRTDSQLRDVLALYKPLMGSGKERQPSRGATGTVLRTGPRKAKRHRAPAGCAAIVPVDATSAKTPHGKREVVPTQGTIVGPRVQVAAPILEQYYVGFVKHASHQSVELGGEPQANAAQATGPRASAARSDVALSGLVQGDPNLTPVLPPGLAVVAAHRAAVTVPSRNGSAPLRLLAENEAGGTLVATTSLSGVTRTTSQVELILAIGSAAAALLAGLGAALVMRRGLQPVESMATQADAITAGDLTNRVSPDDTRTEVGRLGMALNGMLARIDAAVHEQEASQQRDPAPGLAWPSSARSRPPTTAPPKLRRTARMASASPSPSPRFSPAHRPSRAGSQCLLFSFFFALRDPWLAGL
jgi:two-component system OmpR family sensor kinase